MSVSRRLLFVVCVCLFLIAGCSDLNERSNEFPLKLPTIDKSNQNIRLTTYAQEVGFTLDAPMKNRVEANTVVDLEGNLEEISGLEWEHIWVTITSEKKLEEIDRDIFNYYIPVENGRFSEQITLHNGAGEYEVSIRVPSNKKVEEAMYYDVATFDLINLDEDVRWEVEYTAYGSRQGVALTKPQLGLQVSENSVYIEGEISSKIKDDIVLVQVKKGSESEQLILPLVDGVFSGDVPLYFGEGLYTISVQVFNEIDELYYDSAVFYADNPSTKKFAEIMKTQEYIERGIMINKPDSLQNKVYDQQSYQISGTVDPAVPGAEDISYIIVTVSHLEDELESGYLIPVEDYQFDGTAYFRFGPGNYDVVISVPTIEQHDQSMFHYQGVARINHEVVNIKDERGLLPSRGIESDHPAIIEQAKQLTANYHTDRDKAKAIYTFVAQHVAYDVKKAEYDLFNIGDSALSTLQTGSGICQDYAFLTTALLRAIGMESHYVQGDAGERHAWVEVKVDGDWLEMDPTWGAGYVQDGVFHFNYTEDYFDPDPAFLAETHQRDGILY